jgi:predicted N-formylglutamate amidohydrolase
MLDDNPAFEIVGDRHHTRPLVVTCEHASNRLPEDIPTQSDDLPWFNTHWGWDPGAGAVTRELVKHKKCVAILSNFSRLICDPNRHISEWDWIREKVEEHTLSFNHKLDASERQRRRECYHEPFHDEIDACLKERVARGGDVLLLSIHSFTPILGDEVRPMEMGVLYDRFDPVAERFAGTLRDQGFVTALNEPYSGKDGAIYSAGRHGCRHGVIYLELEIRQDTINTQEKVVDVAQRLAVAIDALKIRGLQRDAPQATHAAD